MINLFYHINTLLYKRDLLINYSIMENKEQLLDLIESMENHYIHSMGIYHAVLSETFKEIDQNREYTNIEIKQFFDKNNDLYESGWLNGYLEAINLLKNTI